MNRYYRFCTKNGLTSIMTEDCTLDWLRTNSAEQIYGMIISEDLTREETTEYLKTFKTKAAND